jgi:hypothetical protein
MARAITAGVPVGGFHGDQDLPDTEEEFDDPEWGLTTSTTNPAIAPRRTAARPP